MFLCIPWFKEPVRTTVSSIRAARSSGCGCLVSRVIRIGSKYTAPGAMPQFRSQDQWSRVLSPWFCASAGRHSVALAEAIPPPTRVLGGMLRTLDGNGVWASGLPLPLYTNAVMASCICCWKARCSTVASTAPWRSRISPSGSCFPDVCIRICSSRAHSSCSGVT